MGEGKKRGSANMLDLASYLIWDGEKWRGLGKKDQRKLSTDETREGRGKKGRSGSTVKGVRYQPLNIRKSQSS